ncbi:hypothetical protein MIMGU_mgv1a017454mg [Erythranthe guttata]|uniref:Uncharacterized protein n=1 Tax=Erythranthe guttata TaxID=4155 RepID=A0A022R5L7_ERYGU|nr:hypothetical protein MIMGU_mgv1a017454mg [Erythranthe guttata]
MGDFSLLMYPSSSSFLSILKKCMMVYKYFVYLRPPFPLPPPEPPPPPFLSILKKCMMVTNIRYGDKVHKVSLPI